jgi:hypothetical protein
MSARASKLRSRISIDPDQISTPQPAPRPPLQPVEAPAEPATSPAPRSEPDATETALESTRAEAEAPAAKRGSAARTSARKASSGPNWETCLDDPSIIDGRNGYRSFYIDDAVFARFRSAIYWLARREETVGEVPANMSVAVQEFMETTAEDLERRFNRGRPFRPTPEQVKAAKKRRSKSE